MTATTIKTLCLGFLAASLLAVGVAAPAQAATLSPTASSSTDIGTSGTNAVPIEITATLATVGAASSIKVFLPTGWSFVSPSNCAATITKSATNGTLSNCFVTVSGPESWIYIDNGGSPWSAAVTVTVTFNQGVLNVGTSRDFNVEFKDSNTVIDSGVASLAVGSGGGGTSGGGTPSTTSPSSSLNMAAGVGDLVAGSTVAIVADGLATTASYEVVLRSTPQTLASGVAVAGAVNTSVTIPAGLEAGWHSLTFTSTAADGTAVSNVLYFEISSTGVLLETTSTKPAALSDTGFSASAYLMLGLMLTLAGVAVLSRSSRRQGVNFPVVK